MSTSRSMAQDKAARLLKKRGSASSLASNEHLIKQHHDRHYKAESMSTVSYMDEPGHDMRMPLKMENTFQMGPNRRFPEGQVTNIIHEVMEGYLAEEKYEPELCRQMTKTVSEVIKARVKELMIPRFKIICIVHIGQLKEQGIRVGSRCLWDHAVDTFSSYEFRNNSLFAIGTVYGVYLE